MYTAATETAPLFSYATTPGTTTTAPPAQTPEPAAIPTAVAQPEVAAAPAASAAASTEATLSPETVSNITSAVQSYISYAQQYYQSQGQVCDVEAVSQFAKNYYTQYFCQVAQQQQPTSAAAEPAPAATPAQSQADTAASATTTPAALPTQETAQPAAPGTSTAAVLPNQAWTAAAWQQQTASPVAQAVQPVQAMQMPTQQMYQWPQQAMSATAQPGVQWGMQPAYAQMNPMAASTMMGGMQFPVQSMTPAATFQMPGKPF